MVTSNFNESLGNPKTHPMLLSNTREHHFSQRWIWTSKSQVVKEISSLRFLETFRKLNWNSMYLVVPTILFLLLVFSKRFKMLFLQDTVLHYLQYSCCKVWYQLFLLLCRWFAMLLWKLLEVFLCVFWHKCSL